MSRIDVYGDWMPGEAPRRLGTLRSRDNRASELFDFTFDDAVLDDATLSQHSLDPDLSLFAGAQYPKAGRTIFGAFKDSSPDRWGEMIIRRRFERARRAGMVSPTARLGQADFLLGVHDAFRSGALRYKIAPEGPFLDNHDGTAAPPFVRLRELEAAAGALESHDDDDDEVDEWLRLLLAPGASLGGARPKATVVDPLGRLWIAKFPSGNDRFDVGNWERLVQILAQRCGLRASVSDARVFGGPAHTFMVQRFDRREANGRIHFASAMTLTGHSDGDGAASGASYLEIAEVITSRGAAPREDLAELWSRIAFNVMVTNTDDHLRNHGFLLTPGVGWRLSPAYDMNPVPTGSGLALNIDEHDNALDLDLVRSVADYFRVKPSDAKAKIAEMTATIRGWRDIADSLGIKRSEQSEMADAFLLSDRSPI